MAWISKSYRMLKNRGKGPVLIACLGAKNRTIPTPDKIKEINRLFFWNKRQKIKLSESVSDFDPERHPLHSL